MATDRISRIAEEIRQDDDTAKPLDIRVREATKPGKDKKRGIYQMATSPRGLAVIINIENFPIPRHKRHGSDVDVKNLKDLCEQLDFKVETYKDLDAEHILTTLDSVVKNPLLPITDMLMVFIMSHGEKDIIYGHDGNKLETEEILGKFTCKELKDKPKFIVFQACRGEKIDVGLSRMVFTDSKPLQSNMNPTRDPIWKDMLIAYSTIPGYKAHRDSWYGSWFIKALVRVFMEDACNNDLHLMLIDVEKVLNQFPHKDGHKQSIEISYRGFHRSLFFNPGLSKEKLKSTSYPVNMNMEQTIRPGSKNMEMVNRNQGFTFTDHNLKKDIHTPRLTNTDQADHSLERPGSSFTDHNLKKNVHTLSFTNTDHSLEKGSYKIQKIETGSIVCCLQYDNEKIVAGLFNGSIHTYNKHTLKLENIIEAHSDTVNCLQFDKNILLSGFQDKTVKIWQNYTYKLLNTLKLDNTVKSIKCNFNDKLVTGTWGGQLSVWRINSPTDIKLTKVLHSGGDYFCVDFDNKHIVNGCNNNIQVWSTKSLELLKTMTTRTRHTDLVRTLQLKDNLVVSGSDDKTIRIWVIETGQCIRKLKGHNDWVRCVRFEARRIVSASGDKTIKIWDLEAALDTNNASINAVCIRTLEEHSNYVNCLQFDDTHIISGSQDKTIRIWNFQTTGIIHGSDVEKRLSKEKHKAKFVPILFD